MQSTLRRFTLLALSAAGLAALLPSCSNVPGSSPLAAYHAYDRPAKLPTNPKNVRVKVSLSKQRCYVMEGNEMLLAMPVTVGKPSTPTPSGNFTIYHKEAKRRANTHGFGTNGTEVRRMWRKDLPPGWKFTGTPMPYWCEFKTAYGIHTGWLRHEPASLGCIRMHENLAPKFFRIVPAGAPLNIAHSQPEDAQWASMPLPPDAGTIPDYNLSMFTTDGYFNRHKTPEYVNQ